MQRNGIKFQDSEHFLDQPVCHTLHFKIRSTHKLYVRMGAVQLNNAVANDLTINKKN